MLGHGFLVFRGQQKRIEIMTLQQLKYIITVAETGTITEAANQLYISQPSLTNAIHELEKEMNLTIFNRTNKGITISKEGEEFLGYARQVLEQAAILEDKYKGNGGGKKQFCVSTQHYSFAVNAFVDLIKKYGQDEYDFSLRETQTYEIIEDVTHMRSEIGILFLNEFNETVLNKILKAQDLRSSAENIHLQEKRLLQMKNWKNIRIFLLSRENIILSIFQKRFSLLQRERKISVSETGQHCLIF